MPCNECGAPTKVVDQHGGTKSGSFVENWECANGHTGTVKGEASEMPQKWDRYGSVFSDV